MTKAKYFPLYALSCLATGAPLCAVGATAAEPSAVTVLAGYWDPQSVAFHDAGLTITAAQVTVGDWCSVPYSIIKDAKGQGPSDIREKDATDWREIVIELKPKTQTQQSCFRWKVLAFSIKKGVADIALYLSRAKFESKPDDSDGWGEWIKMDSH